MNKAQAAIFFIAKVLIFWLSAGVIAVAAATTATTTATATATAAATQSQAVQVVDDRGVTVKLAQPPLRIVSLLPSLTETVCALGRCQHLVGVDRYSNYPESVRGLPKMGGGLDPSVEAIVAMKPDVVLLAQSSRVVDRLQSLGVTVVVMEPKTHADVRRVMEQLGGLLAVPDATRLWRWIEAEVAAASQSMPALAKGQRVYFEVDATPYAAGEASFIGETLTRLGTRNVVPATLGPFPKLNPEFVVRANPQVIMVGEGSHATLAMRPGWAKVAAVQDRRICSFTREQGDMLVRPGPRMGEAARLMVQCLVRPKGVAP